MPTYTQVKEGVLKVLDEFSGKPVTANYAPNGSSKYKASTKLSELFHADLLSTLPHDFNRIMKKACDPDPWKTVGSLDMAGKATIADLIWLACTKAKVTPPEGEPQ